MTTLFDDQVEEDAPRPASDVDRMLDMFDGLGLSDYADNMAMVMIPDAAKCPR